MQVAHFDSKGEVVPLRLWPDELAPPKPGDLVRLAADGSAAVIVSFIYHDLPGKKTWIIVDFGGTDGS